MGLNPASMGLLVYESDVECMTLTLIMCYDPVGRPIPSHGILWDVPRHITGHHRTCYRVPWDAMRRPFGSRGVADGTP